MTFCTQISRIVNTNTKKFPMSQKSSTEHSNFLSSGVLVSYKPVSYKKRVYQTCCYFSAVTLSQVFLYKSYLEKELECENQILDAVIQALYFSFDY